MVELACIAAPLCNKLQNGGQILVLRDAIFEMVIDVNRQPWLL